jgi:hypothetical protein
MAMGTSSEQIARKAAALFVSLWLRGVSASFCDKIMSGMIWFVGIAGETGQLADATRPGRAIPRCL